ncbi:TPA: hypothetical protein ACW4X5_004838, partial [Salmonella enterica]
FLHDKRVIKKQETTASRFLSKKFSCVLADKHCHYWFSSCYVTAFNEASASCMWRNWASGLRCHEYLLNEIRFAPVVR